MPTNCKLDHICYDVVRTSIAGWDKHIQRSDGPGSSGGGHLLGQDHIPSFVEVCVGEDKANVAYGASEPRKARHVV